MSMCGREVGAHIEQGMGKCAGDVRMKIWSIGVKDQSDIGIGN